MKSDRFRKFAPLALILALVFCLIPLLSDTFSHKEEELPLATERVMGETTSSGVSLALSQSMFELKHLLAKSGREGDTSGEKYTVTASSAEATPVPSPTEEKPENIPPIQSDLPYAIIVYIPSCRVVVYGKDDAGEFTVPVKVFTVSPGLGSNTIRGTYRVASKWRWLPMHGATIYCQYVTQWCGNYLFHSVMYSRPDPGTLDRSAYAKLGTKASAGCIRMTVRDAKWIYDNCPRGTVVITTNNSVPAGTPGSAGVPAMTLNVAWDPTDPDPNNPYRGGAGTAESGTTTGGGTTPTTGGESTPTGGDTPATTPTTGDTPGTTEGTGDTPGTTPTTGDTPGTTEGTGDTPGTEQGPAPEGGPTE